MPNIAEGDIIAFSIEGQIFGQRTLFTQTYQVQIEEGAPAVDVVEYLDAFLQEVKSGGPDPIVDSYAAVLSETWQSLKISAQKVSGQRSVRRDLVQAVVGARGPTSVGFTTAVITSRTNLAGRDQVANHHIGPLAAADVANGLITALLETEFAQLLDDLLEPTGPGGQPMTTMVPVIWHKKLPGPTIFADLVTSTYLQEEARTQRTRRVGHGI